MSAPVPAADAPSAAAPVIFNAVLDAVEISHCGTIPVRGSSPGGPRWFTDQHCRGVSEMDARVKGAVEIGGVVGVHGGGWDGVGRPARRQRQRVTLRCAGRDRMAVSGRELPRTKDASRDRIDQFEDSQDGRADRPTPAGVEGLVGSQAAATSATSAGCGWRSGAWTIAAQMNPTSSRATAVVATVERFPLVVKVR